MDEASMDAIIEDAQPKEAVEPELQETVTETPTEETTTETPEPSAEKEEVQFPKKAVNAISYRDRKIGQQKAQLEQANARIAAVEAELAKSKPTALPNGVPLKLETGEPNPDAYTDYQKYLDDRQDWRLEQREAARSKETESTQAQTQQQQFIAERQTAFTSELKTDKEATALLEEYADLEVPDHIANIFLEAEPADAIRAFKVLAKEGRLEALIAMPLARAAMEIGKAQIATTPKPKTNAPKPLPASRGSVAGDKSLEQMSGAELVAWVKS